MEMRGRWEVERYKLLREGDLESRVEREIKRKSENGRELSKSERKSNAQL